MRKEYSTEELAAVLDRVLAFRCKGIDPTELNLRFCPSVEDCDGPGRSIVLRFRTYSWMANPMGVTHGGMVSAILDASMGTLCTTFAGVLTPTITMTTNYCRPVPLETEILVRARLTHLGRTSGQLSAEMYLPGEERSPLATATGVYYTAHAEKEQK